MSVNCQQFHSSLNVLIGFVLVLIKPKLSKDGGKFDDFVFCCIYEGFCCFPLQSYHGIHPRYRKTSSYIWMINNFIAY